MATKNQFLSCDHVLRKYKESNHTRWGFFYIRLQLLYNEATSEIYSILNPQKWRKNISPLMVPWTHRPNRILQEVLNSSYIKCKWGNNTPSEITATTQIVRVWWCFTITTSVQLISQYFVFHKRFFFITKAKQLVIANALL